MVNVKRLWRVVAFVGLLAGVVMLTSGAMVALSLGSPEDPNGFGVALAAVGFISIMAGGLSLANILFFNVLGRIDEPE